jgi:deoxyribonuclease V
VSAWPRTPEALVAAQLELAAVEPEPWRPGASARVGACFVCFERGQGGRGRRGDRGWAAAALAGTSAIATGKAGAPYEPGLLALREGELLEAAVRLLPERPDVLLVDATGRDHPRRAGLALQLGALLELPTVGVTHRPLAAAGAWPPLTKGARSPLVLDKECVGYWLCTRSGRRPVAVHAAWRTDPETAVAVVLGCAQGPRTPQPLRAARRAARQARWRDTRSGRAPPRGRQDAGADCEKRAGT